MTSIYVHTINFKAPTSQIHPTDPIPYHASPVFAQLRQRSRMAQVWPKVFTPRSHRFPPDRPICMLHQLGRLEQSAQVEPATGGCW